MKELQVKIRPKEEDICFYPDDLKKIKFLGLQTKTGGRYFRTNWASSENDYVFWYPFVGGAEATVYTTLRSEENMAVLLRTGCKFFSFESAEEMYLWLGYIG